MLLGRKLISPADMALFKVTDSMDEAVNEVLGFYRVYHSMRYVGPDLVLRLQKAPPPELLERIRTEFAGYSQRRYIRGDGGAAGRGQRHGACRAAAIALPLRPA